MTTATEEKALDINPFQGGARAGNKRITFDHCILRDPREEMPSDWTGFEVLTAKDGGKRVSWSRLNFEQIQEAKEKFEKFIAEGLVPYYIDPDTGQTTDLTMATFDPAAGAVMFEDIQYEPKNITFAPTRLAAGG